MENCLELGAPHRQTNPVIVSLEGNGKKWRDMAGESPASGTRILRIQRKQSENGVCIY